MDITAPVTDYIPGGILTIRGDLLKRGVVNAERFPRGDPKQVLRVVSSGLDLEYVNAGDHMFENQWSGANAGIVTLLSTTTIILSINLGTLLENEVIYFQGHVNVLNVDAPGYIMIEIARSAGVANVYFFNDDTSLEVRTLFSTGGIIEKMIISGIMRVVSGGTCTMSIRGTSSGGDSTIQIGDAQLWSTFLRKL